LKNEDGIKSFYITTFYKLDSLYFITFLFHLIITPTDAVSTFYLYDLLQFRTSIRHLRSSDHCLLHNSGTRTAFGSRMFCHATL